MPNDLTALTPVLYSAAQEVSNEPFGVVDSILANFDDKGVAIGDSVKVPIAPTRTHTAYTPAMTTTAGTSATAESVAVVITANEMVDWQLTGEQQLSLQNADSDKDWVRQMIAQGMRSLRNGAEADAALAIKQGASRAYGTAGTTPFASDLSALTNLYKMLKDNGAPMADLQCVVNTAAGLNLRNQNIIQQAYQAGSDQERRSGQFLRQFGFQIKESAGIAAHTPGGGTSYVTSGSHAAGTKAIVLTGGSGTVLTGDIVTFAADTVNKYVVNTGIAADGTAYIGRPGLKVTVATANAMTIGAAYTPNMAFERSAIVGVMRPPAIPASPLIQQIPISDKYGMTYLLCEIVGDGMITWRLHLAWGFKVVQSEHVMLLLG